MIKQLGWIEKTIFWSWTKNHKEYGKHKHTFSSIKPEKLELHLKLTWHNLFLWRTYIGWKKSYLIIFHREVNNKIVNGIEHHLVNTGSLLHLAWRHSDMLSHKYIGITDKKKILDWCSTVLSAYWLLL